MAYFYGQGRQFTPRVKGTASGLFTGQSQAPTADFSGIHYGKNPPARSGDFLREPNRPLDRPFTLPLTGRTGPGMDEGTTDTGSDQCPGTPIGTHPGCNCGRGYYLASGNCSSGYTLYGEGQDRRCECDAWVAAGRPGGNTDSNELGEFQWPADLAELRELLLGRARDLLNPWDYSPDVNQLLTGLTARGNEYLNRRPGFSNSMLDLMLGSGVDRMRAGENVRRAGMMNELQREGLTGTGAGNAMLRGDRLATEQSVGNMIRDLIIQNELQKNTDRAQFSTIANQLFGATSGAQQAREQLNQARTGLSNTLFGSGMTWEQIREAINSGRRGEGLSAMALWLQYLQNLLSSWGNQG